MLRCGGGNGYFVRSVRRLIAEQGLREESPDGGDPPASEENKPNVPMIRVDIAPPSVWCTCRAKCRQSVEWMTPNRDSAVVPSGSGTFVTTASRMIAFPREAQDTLFPRTITPTMEVLSRMITFNAK